MSKKIFVNLPVKNLEATKTFFAALGFTFNKQFTNEDAACMVISEDIYTMLLVEPFFKTFINKNIVDAKKETEVLVALSADSKEEVDDMMQKALTAGANEPREAQDQGFMYSRAFEDLDGHIWELVYMDPSAIQQG